VKIETLIVQHLYQNRQVTLQGIGIITLSPSVTLPTPQEKEFQFPENAFQFVFDRKAGEDEGLIDFIVTHTRKIKPLASADLDSFLTLSKQFLNIGKPLVIEGVGTIQKDQAGNFVFMQGIYIAPRLEDVTQPELKEKREESVSFDTPRKKDSSRIYLIGIALLVLATLLTLSVVYMLKDNKPEQAEVPVDEPVLDTHLVDTTQRVVGDSAMAVKDSIGQAASLALTDTIGFAIVVKSFKTEAMAAKSLEKLKSYGHQLVELRKLDSANWVITMPFQRPKRDSILVRDSLRRFFGGNPLILPMK
jgi:hypothetical protein